MTRNYIEILRRFALLVYLKDTLKKYFPSLFKSFRHKAFRYLEPKKNLKRANKHLHDSSRDFQGNMPLRIHLIAHTDALETSSLSNDKQPWARLADDSFGYASELLIDQSQRRTPSAWIKECLRQAELYHLSVRMPSAFERPIQRLCAYLNEYVAIDQDGDVYPCPFTNHARSMKMGSLRESPLADIWYGRRYGILRDSFLASDLTPVCRQCQYESAADTVEPHWNIENYSRRALEYREHLQYLANMQRHEHSLFDQQQELYRRAKQIEKDIEQQLELTFTSQNQKEELPDLVKRYLPNRVDDFSLFASTTTDRSISRVLNRAVFNQGLAFQGNFPVRIEMSLLHGCNIRCEMCTLVSHSEETIHRLTQEQMDVETFEQLAREVFPMIENLIIGVAGEPTIHPRFPEIARIAGEMGVEVQLMTNGMSLTSTRIAKAVAQHVRKIFISVEGSTKETYERIRRGASWERLLNGIRKLVEYRSELGTNLEIIFSHTLMKDTIDEFPDLIEVAHTVGVDRVIGQHLIVTFSHLQDQSLYTMPEYTNRKLIEAVERAKLLGVQIQIPGLLSVRNQSKPIETISQNPVIARELDPSTPFCGLLTYSVSINAYGHVFPCCHPEAHRLFRMGELKKQSFLDIWFGRRYQVLREGHNGKLPYPCCDCTIAGFAQGVVPVVGTREESFLDRNEYDRKPYPKSFAPRRIEFHDLLERQNNDIRQHLSNIQQIRGKI